MENIENEIVNLKIETPVQEVRLGEVTLQRGHIYSCKKTGEETELDGAAQFGFFGNDVPPCAAEFLCDTGDGYLVISAESTEEEIETVDGWTLAPAELEIGEVFDDGTWTVVVIKAHGDGEFTVAGTL